MKTKGLVLCLVLALATGCSTTPPAADASGWIEPAQAVQLAAASPRRGTTGVFVMTVKATGKTRLTHLNSERDYRDQRNLSIAISPFAAEQFAAQFGAPPDIALRDRRIAVSGTARRVRIDFVVEGKPSGKYYYQTHVDVSDASQIRVLP